jgi:dolichol-phosphate mannosyltransferase
MSPVEAPIVVVPTYNEIDNLPRLVDRLWALPVEGLRLLIVDDASPDGSGRLADELAQKHRGRIVVLHRAGKLGLGTAYLTGFREALRLNPSAILQMDADFSHAPEEIPGMIEALAEADAAFGSRYVAGGRLDDRWSVGRVALSRFGNWYARGILRLPVRDVTGGFRAWRAATLRGLPLERIRSNGYVFQVEMAYVAHRLGFHIVERPIYFEDRRYGRSKMSFRIQAEAALRVWQVLLTHRGLRPPAR